MKVGLVGLPLSGKTTVFNALSGFEANTGMGQKSNEPNRAVVKVVDERIDKLTEIYKPKKKIYATVEYSDFPGIQDKSGGNFWASVRNVDVLVQIVRAFEDISVPHVRESVDVERDIRDINSELILADLAVVENNLDKLERNMKSGKSRDQEQKQELLLRCKQILEQELPLRSHSFSENEFEILRPYHFITRKPTVIVVNIGEGQSAEEYETKARNTIGESKEIAVMSICGKLEMEVAQLPGEEQQMFLEELGIAELALHRFVRHSFSLLGMISFFTVGEDEVRAWEIREETKAVDAAGVIHSDLQRGFIRAEVFHYDDLMALDGQPGKLKDAGKMRLEGKEYIVVDGDILCIRFNVSGGKRK